MCAALAGLATGRSFVGSVAVVTGSSMAPTFAQGTRVYTTPISSPIDRGDIVVIDDGSPDYAIKRIVGLPGETVYIWRGYVFINGQILLEPYVGKRNYTFPRQRLAVFTLGEEQYFVLGDNRPNSADSRIYGPVDRSHVKKRVPLPDNTMRARFGPFTLPTYGKTLRAVSKLG